MVFTDLITLKRRSPFSEIVKLLNHKPENPQTWGYQHIVDLHKVRFFENSISFLPLFRSYDAFDFIETLDESLSLKRKTAVILKVIKISNILPVKLWIITWSSFQAIHWKEKCKNNLHDYFQRFEVDMNMILSWFFSLRPIANHDPLHTEWVFKGSYPTIVLCVLCFMKMKIFVVYENGCFNRILRAKADG